jgi:2-polyprenyl-3-methyl-5-hydroxy-6-metoxy-1,4-benzoquinol methylase
VDRLYEAPGTWDLSKCTNLRCGLIWVNPAPLAEDLPLAYQTYFTHGSKDESAKSGARFRLMLYSIYRVANKVAAALFGLQESKAKMATMYLGELRPGKVLDVGCGDGKFLNRMRNLGWSVDGVDFDGEAIKSAKVKYGLELRHGSLESVGFPDHSIEALTMSHSIEHVPDPVAVLQEARRIVKPGGRIVVSTPNADSLGHERFADCWLGLDPPRHLHVFTLGALQACGERAGLRTLQVLSSAANADILLGGSYALREVGDHRGSQLPRPNINVSRALKASFLQYRELAQLKGQPSCGEEAVLISEAPSSK